MNYNKTTNTATVIANCEAVKQSSIYKGLDCFVALAMTTASTFGATSLAMATASAFGVASFAMTTVLALGMFTSCDYDHLPTYEEAASVYFLQPSKVDSAIVDLTIGAFTLKDDSLLRIPIQLLGKVSLQDRPIAYQLLSDTSTAIEGTDIECLPSFIEAGKSSGYLNVRLKNSTALQERGDTLFALLQLLPNEYLRTDYNALYASKPGKNSLQFRVYITSRLGGKPRLWRMPGVGQLMNAGLGGNMNVDIYSDRLYKILLDVCNIPEELFDYTDEEYEASAGDNMDFKGKNMFYARFGTGGVVGYWAQQIAAYLAKHPEIGDYNAATGKITIY
jgi:hypothetical protein